MEIKASELRIGNLVETPKGRAHKVKIIDKTSNMVFHGFEINESYLKFVGFVKDNNGNWWIDLQTHYLELMQSNGYWYPTYVQVPEMSSGDEQRVGMNRIEFIHQLQNLYFALTGTELKKQ